MADFPKTGTRIYGVGDRNRTGVGLSTQIIVKVDTLTVGAIQSLSIKENRSIEMVNELGVDGSVDSSPIKSTEIGGSCNRVRLDRLRVSEAFGRGFLHAHSQRIPFDIDIYDYWAGDANPIKTTIKNVWITGLSYDYKVDNWIIFDQMEWKAEAISSTINGASAITGGERGLGFMQQNLSELAADAGKTRGGLNSGGLINDYFTGI